MNRDIIFVGDIKICTGMKKHNTFEVDDFSYGYREISKSDYKNQAILIKTHNNRYIDIDTINDKAELLFLLIMGYKKHPSNTFRELTMLTTPISKGDLYVDFETLKSYSEVHPEADKDIPFMTLKKTR